MALTFDQVIEKLRGMVRPGYLVGIPAMYLAGTAYHQGYLAGLGVNSTLFPLGLNDTYIQAFLGTVSVLTALVAGAFAHQILSSVRLIILVVSATFMLHRKEVAPNPQSPEKDIDLLDKFGAPIEKSAKKRCQGQFPSKKQAKKVSGTISKTKKGVRDNFKAGKVPGTISTWA